MRSATWLRGTFRMRRISWLHTYQCVETLLSDSVVTRARGKHCARLRRKCPRLQPSKKLRALALQPGFREANAECQVVARDFPDARHFPATRISMCIYRHRRTQEHYSFHSLTSNYRTPQERFLTSPTHTQIPLPFRKRTQHLGRGVMGSKFGFSLKCHISRLNSLGNSLGIENNGGF